LPKANPNQIRLPVMFDLTDPRQKAAYEILKNAGYGKRTPTIVDALLDSLKTNALLSQAKESGVSNVSETDIRRAVEDSMESVLNRYFSKSEIHASEPQREVLPVQAPAPAPVIQEPVPVQHVHEPQPSFVPYVPTVPVTAQPTVPDEGHMNQLLSIADAFF
jgi:hypothetical protein